MCIPTATQGQMPPFLRVQLNSGLTSVNGSAARDSAHDIVSDQKTLFSAVALLRWQSLSTSLSHPEW